MQTHPPRKPRCSVAPCSRRKKKSGSPQKSPPPKSPRSPKRASSPPRVSLADKYAPVSSTPLYNSLATPVRPVPPLGYRHVAARGPSPALAGRELQEVNIDAVEYPPSREAPVRKPRKEPKLIEKARFAKKIGEIVLQVKISQRDFPSPRDPSDVVIEAFEEIAGERFILSA